MLDRADAIGRASFPPWTRPHVSHGCGLEYGGCPRQGSHCAQQPPIPPILLLAAAWAPLYAACFTRRLKRYLGPSPTWFFRWVALGGVRSWWIISPSIRGVRILGCGSIQRSSVRSGWSALRPSAQSLKATPCVIPAWFHGDCSACVAWFLTARGHQLKGDFLSS